MYGYGYTPGVAEQFYANPWAFCWGCGVPPVAVHGVRGCGPILPELGMRADQPMYGTPWAVGGVGCRCGGSCASCQAQRAVAAVRGCGGFYGVQGYPFQGVGAVSLSSQEDQQAQDLGRILSTYIERGNLSNNQMDELYFVCWRLLDLLNVDNSFSTVFGTDDATGLFNALFSLENTARAHLMIPIVGQEKVDAAFQALRNFLGYSGGRLNTAIARMFVRGGESIQDIENPDHSAGTLPPEERRRYSTVLAGMIELRGAQVQQLQDRLSRCSSTASPQQIQAAIDETQRRCDLGTANLNRILADTQRQLAAAQAGGAPPDQQAAIAQAVAENQARCDSWGQGFQNRIAELERALAAAQSGMSLADQQAAVRQIAQFQSQIMQLQRDLATAQSGASQSQQALQNQIAQLQSDLTAARAACSRPPTPTPPPPTPTSPPVRPTRAPVRHTPVPYRPWAVR